jgi:predicted nuclease of predicted toxin-antitoxin system
MSVALYLDEQVPRQIATGLRLRGVDVLTIQEDGRSGTTDPILLDRATELGRVIFSRDQDFLIEANRRQKEGVYFSGVIYAHQQRVTIGDCIRDLELIGQAGNPEDFVNRVQYLPL